MKDIVMFVAIGIALGIAVLYVVMLKKYHNYLVNIDMYPKLKKKHPIRFVIIITVLGMFFYVTLQVLTLYNFQGYRMEDIVEENKVVQLSLTNDSNYYYYSSIETTDDGVLVTTADTDMNYGIDLINMDFTVTFSKSITKFDQYDHVVWSIDEDPLSNIVISSIHYQFLPRDINQLTTGEYISFGMYIDKNNLTRGIGALLIDNNGDITDLIKLGHSEYLYIETNEQAYFEILPTDDEGFAILYYDESYRSFLSKYDSTYQEEWTVEIFENDYYPYTYGDDVTSTHIIQYDGERFITLLNNKITAINSQGNIIWTYDNNPSQVNGIQLHNGYLYAYGVDVVVGKDSQGNIEYIHNRMLSNKFNVESGVIESGFTFDYKTMWIDNRYISPTIHDIFFDNNDNIYLVTNELRTQDSSQFGIIKCSSDFDYLGIAFVSQSIDITNYSDNYSPKGVSTFKYSQGILSIYNPSIGIKRTVNISALEYHTEYSNEFNRTLYRTIYYSMIFILYFELPMLFICLSVYLVYLFDHEKNKHHKYDFINTTYNDQEENKKNIVQ